jgi:hypothetical protein
MRKEIEIVVPKDWSAITLRKYIELQSDLKAYEGESEAILAAMFYHLCGLTPNILHKLDTETYIKIRDDLFSFTGNTNVPLVQTFKHNGIEYGFYPNLSKIEYGAYADISKLISDSFNDDWAKAMNILYRPITKKVGKLYEVEDYALNDDWEWFLDLGMHIHFGAWFFFINLSTDLLSGILNSMTQRKDIPQNIKQILHESGEAIQQLSL